MPTAATVLHRHTHWIDTHTCWIAITLASMRQWDNRVLVLTCTGADAHQNACVKQQQQPALLIYITQEGSRSVATILCVSHRELYRTTPQRWNMCSYSCFRSQELCHDLLPSDLCLAGCNTYQGHTRRSWALLGQFLVYLARCCT